MCVYNIINKSNYILELKSLVLCTPNIGLSLL